MKILKNLARSMICVAAGLLLYCGSFYIKSYEQNKTCPGKRINMWNSLLMPEVTQEMTKQLKIRIQEITPDKAEKNLTQKRRK